MRRLPPTLERIAAAVSLATAFIIMASVFAPDLSHAESDRLTTPAVTPSNGSVPVNGSTPDPAYPGEEPQPASVTLGSIEDDRYIINVYAGPSGPRYSVSSRDSGAELGVMMTAEEVAEWFPDLPLPGMEFGAESALMLVDPAAEHLYP